MNRIRAIIGKEIIEMSKNKMIVFTMALLPLLILAISLGTLYAIGSGLGGDSLKTGINGMPDYLKGMDPKDAVGIMMVTQYLFLFLVVPASIPVTIASYSIVGEKEAKSLEPLLATPIRTWELLLAKSLAAAIPGAVISWLIFGTFVLGVRIISSAAVFAVVTNPVWIIANIVVSPLLATLSVLAGVIASSRMNDPRAVQQLVAFLVVPIVLIGIGQSTGLFLVNAAMISLGALLVLLIDAGLLFLAVRLFQRETILTRWR
jgi:ABC-2 type transport system permease protein